jgi:hypothetical protein
VRDNPSRVLRRATNVLPQQMEYSIADFRISITKPRAIAHEMNAVERDRSALAEVHEGFFAAL